MRLTCDALQAEINTRPSVEKPIVSMNMCQCLHCIVIALALEVSIYVDIKIQMFVSSMEQIQQCEQEMNQVFAQWIHHVQQWTLQSAQDLDTTAEGIVSSFRYLRHHLEDLLIQLDAIQFTDQYDPARDRRRHVVQRIDGFLARNAL